MTETTKLQPLGSTAELGAELERELRAAINPLYEDVRGTESYERKRLLGEIDRLRAELKIWHCVGQQLYDAGFRSFDAPNAPKLTGRVNAND